MKYLSLPPGPPRRLAFYLAMEEWAARTLPEGEYFFSWRVAPTVICGRNQEIAKEVDIIYCRQQGIDLVRRRSGGGAVYADMDNYMFSYIAPGESVETTFARYTLLISSMLCSLGIEARATGRNDIVVGGRKISGNAFYHLPGRSIAHGTMLYNFDPSVLGRVLTPSRAKMESKGVTSVESRVTSLVSEGLRMGHEEFEAYAINYMTDDEIALTPNDIEAITAIESRYYTDAWMADRVRHSREEDGYTERNRRIEGVGDFSVKIKTNAGGYVERAYLSGDFFLSGDPEALFLSHIRGVPYSRPFIRAAIAQGRVEDAIPGLTPDLALDLLID